MRNKITLFIFLTLLSCTKQEDPKVIANRQQREYLERKLKETEGLLSEYDNKIAAAKDNPGLQHQYSQQKELAKSRLERLKFNLQQLPAK
jgi:hypothetical protein